jgi:2-polyprenyl-6-methoxyphenol hydroxylase-like FAD-dependent oxidoreductase
LPINNQTDVLIVGAGPTGLALACQLIRYGIDFVIIDKQEGITPYSKAIGVQARTLEIYEQIGIAQRVVELGEITRRARLVIGGKVRGKLELSRLGQGFSPYPFVLIVEQSKHEHVLYDFINTNGRDVLWQTTLENFEQDETRVVATINRVNEQEQKIEAKYLVACDGARSSVRTALGLTFEGSTYERMFYVADVQINWEIGHDGLIASLARHTFTVFFTMPGEKRYRIVGVFPEGFDKDEGEILYEEIERQISKDSKLKLDIYNVNWFSNYRVHSRRVNSFRVGRCFLAGDSAHIHSPAGAQGMNTGIQDGYNLAWKLALVLRGQAEPKLLNTYTEERVAVATRLLQTTDRLFDLIVNPSWFIAFVRLYIFPYVANFAFQTNAVNRYIFPLVSQIGIQYRKSSLSMRGGAGSEVKPGDRMPYFLIEDRSIYDWLRAPCFHLLTFSNDANHHQGAGTEIERDYAGLVDHKVLPLTSRVADVFGHKHSFNVLLRPDNYLAFISRDTSLEGLRAYFAEVIGHGESPMSRGV